MNMRKSDTSVTKHLHLKQTNNHYAVLFLFRLNILFKTYPKLFERERETEREGKTVLCWFKIIV